ncbi:MAG: hypothetical protein WC610_00230 [Patescibacteria group bacterium]
MNNRKSIVCIWFVEPLDKDTNAVIGRMIDPCDNLENYLEAVEGADGQNHNLWQLPNFQMVGSLNASAKGLRLRFKIWVREGNGQIREWFKLRPKAQTKNAGETRPAPAN